ncbi:MAG: hypothetical protein CO099_04880, partial [Bdellovibrio sp. CG_4_9_14_3_um_filter_39_7]
AIPLVVIPFVVFLFDSSKVEKAPLAYGLLFYLLAKITEFSDIKIFEFTHQMISGHTIKHLLASLTVVALAVLVKKTSLKSNNSIV